MSALYCDNCSKEIEISVSDKVINLGDTCQVFVPCQNCAYYNVISYSAPVVVTSYPME